MDVLLATPDRVYAGVRHVLRSRGMLGNGTLGAVLMVGAINLTAQAIGAGKDVLVAAQFGISAGLDAFLIALMVIVLVTNTVAAAFGEAFLPVFVRVRELDGHVAAQAILASATSVGLAVMVLLSVVLALVRWWLIPVVAPGFDASKIELTGELLLVLLPVLALSGLTTTWAAALSAVGRFGVVAIAPALAPIATVVLLLAQGSHWGVFAMAAGLLLGKLVEVVLLGWRLRREDLTCRPRWPGFSPEMRRVLQQGGPLIMASFLATGTSAIDQFMATGVGSGAVSTLSYGTKVPALITGVSNFALTTALFPLFARMVATSDWAGARRRLSIYSGWIWLLVALCAGLLIWGSQWLVELLFQRGSFTASDSLAVSQVQILALLQLPFHAAAIVSVRLLSALGRNELLMLVAFIQVPVDAIGNYVLMKYFGVSGIALSSTLVFTMSSIVLLYLSYSELSARGHPSA